MDDPPMTPTDSQPGSSTTARADAYEQFWDCVESDAPVGDSAPRAASATPHANAYDRFWELSEV
jgi:hypothetical protein